MSSRATSESTQICPSASFGMNVLVRMNSVSRAISAGLERASIQVASAAGVSIQLYIGLCFSCGGTLVQGSGQYIGLASVATQATNGLRGHNSEAFCAYVMPGNDFVLRQNVLGSAAGIALLVFALGYRFLPSFGGASPAATNPPPREQPSAPMSVQVAKPTVEAPPLIVQQPLQPA